MPILSFVLADGAAVSTLTNNQLIGLLVVVGLFILLFSFIGKGKTYKCRKCGFTTTDDLRAAGHVATENKHACDEI